MNRGTGIEYHSNGNPYIFSGRVGTAQDRNFVVGASFANIRNNTTYGVGERDRYGIDIMYYYELFGALAEISWGDNNGTDIRHTILELNWRNPSKKLSVWAQGIHQVKDYAANQTECLGHYGVRYAPDSHWALSAVDPQLSK